MKRFSSIISILFIFCQLAVLPQRAVCEPSPRALSWQDCVEIAVKNNPSIASYFNAMESTRYKYQRSKNYYYPSINIGNSFTRSYNSGLTLNNASVDLSAQQTFFNLKYSADIKVQKANYEKARAQYSSASASARNDLVAAYVGLVYAQERINMFEDIYELRARNSKMIDMQYEGGKESKGNKMRANALAAAAKLDIEKAKITILSARRQLLGALGMDDFQVISATGALASIDFKQNEDVDAMALKVPAVVISRAAVDVANEQLSYAAADLFPTLTSNGSVGWTGITELPQYRNWSAGISLNIPVFSSGITYYKNNRASAKSLLMQTKEDYRQALLTAKYNLEQAVVRMQSSLYELEAAKLLLEASRQRHLEASVQYIAGRMTYQFWEQIEQELVNYEKSYLDALKENNLAKAALDALLGVPLGE